MRKLVYCDIEVKNYLGSYKIITTTEDNLDNLINQLKKQGYKILSIKKWGISKST